MSLKDMGNHCSTMVGPLSNPRHERFAAIIAYGMKPNEPWSQGRAYQLAGYNAKDAGKSGGSAEAAASRLLKKVQPILDRARELQAQVAKRKKVTIESIVDELEEARTVAKDNEQAAAMVAASAGKAKILGLVIDRTEQGKPGDFSHSHNQQDVAKALLRNAGLDESEVNESCCAEAIEALAHFNERIAAIVVGQRSAGQAS